MERTTGGSVRCEPRGGFLFLIWLGRDYTGDVMDVMDSKLAMGRHGELRKWGCFSFCE